MARSIFVCRNVINEITKSRFCSSSHRRFWQWLNIVWNRVDDKRIAEVGPDRACAEWLMRNGAFVKWTNDSEFLKDYNALPAEGDIRYIKEVDATDSSIMHYGFEYFKGCKYITGVKFQRCLYLKDEALENLSYLKDSLQDLQIISCGNITDKGVKSLRILRWYFHPSSGAHTTVSTASGICHTVTAICRYRGRVGTSLSGVCHPQHTQTGSNSSTIAADSSNGVTITRCRRYSS